LHRGNVLFAVWATRLWAGDGITANAVHPGAVAGTNLSRYMSPDALTETRNSSMYKFKTIEQGAATSVLVATSPQLDARAQSSPTTCQIEYKRVTSLGGH